MTYQNSSGNFYSRCNPSNGLEEKCGQYRLEANLDIDDIKRSINIYEANMEYKYNIMVVQSSEESEINFTRKMLYLKAEAFEWTENPPDSFLRVDFKRELKDNERNVEFDLIRKLNSTLEVIGLFKTSTRLYVIIRFDDSIKYCQLRRVSE